VIDVDMELKRVIDQRLARFTPPTRRSGVGRGPRGVQVAVAATIVGLVLSASGILLSANVFAAANGVDCADVFAKARVWAQAQTIDANAGPTKEAMGRIVADSGCIYLKGAPRTIEHPPAKGDVHQVPTDGLPADRTQ